MSASTHAGGDTGSGPKTVVAMHAAADGAARPAASAALALPVLRAHSAFVPLLLLGLAVLAVLGWQTWSLSSERGALNTAFEAQQQTVDNAGKLRASLDGLAADTQRLADRGNPNAAQLVTELKKRGITIDPHAGAAAAAATLAASAPR